MPKGLIALFFGLAVSAAAEAQPELRPERLYLGSGVLAGSTRVIALGGAYTPIAEGATGFTSNLAALAHRSRDLDRRWDLGVAFSFLDLPVTSPFPRDVDNDGRRDEAKRSTQYQAALMLQYQRFGIGTHLRGSTHEFCESAASCAPESFLRSDVQHAALAGAVAFGRDELIVGAGVYVAEVSFAHQEQNAHYGGRGFEVDALYRPVGRPFRVGLSLKPEVVGEYVPDGSRVPVMAGRTLYSAVVSPGVFSLGAAFRFGEGSENFNALSPAAREDLAQRFDPSELPPVRADGKSGTWLVSVQADVVGSTQNAVTITSFTSVDTEAEPLRAGASFLLIPRVGVEHETLPGRLRTRAGSFIEASPFEGGVARAHLTGGAELFLYRYYDDWAASFSFDVARRYQYFGLTFGVWR